MDHLRQSPSRAPEGRRLARSAAACLASLGVHGAVLAGLAGAGAFRPPARSLAVALRPLRGSAWEANRLIEGATAPRSPPRREIVELPPDTRTDPAREERAPGARARFLAERDQTVEKETISRYAGEYARLLRVPQRKAIGRRGSGERGDQPTAAPGRTGLRGGGGSDANAAAPTPVVEARAEAPAAPASPAPEAAAGPVPGDPVLPSDGEGGRRLDGPRVAGLPLREDARPEGGPNLDGDAHGVEEGSETRLHTRRFEPARYWTDVRARLHDDWLRRQAVVLERYDPREDVYFYKPRTVRVALRLDSKGQVMDVHVVESSTLDFYDAVALAAVRGSQPYEPPPPTVIGPDGSARITIAFTYPQEASGLR